MVEFVLFRVERKGHPLFIYQARATVGITSKVGVTKGSEKKGTTKDTKSTKKSFSFPLCPSCTSWFKAFRRSGQVFHCAQPVPSIRKTRKFRTLSM